LKPFQVELINKMWFLKELKDLTVGGGKTETKQFVLTGKKPVVKISLETESRILGLPEKVKKPQVGLRVEGKGKVSNKGLNKVFGGETVSVEKTATALESAKVGSVVEKGLGKKFEGKVKAFAKTQPAKVGAIEEKILARGKVSSITKSAFKVSPTTRTASRLKTVVVPRVSHFEKLKAEAKKIDKSMKNIGKLDITTTRELISVGKAGIIVGASILSPSVATGVSGYLVGSSTKNLQLDLWERI